MDIAAKYAQANSELGQLYAEASQALPLAPDLVLQALAVCRASIQAAMHPTPAVPPPMLQPAPPAAPPPAQPAQPVMAPPPGAYPAAAAYQPAPVLSYVSGQGPAPPPPAVLMPVGATVSRAPEPPPEQANFTRRSDNWPPRSYHKSLGEAIYQAQETPGHVRHEVIIERRTIGRILGKGGRDLAAMKEQSGSEVFIIDKEPPPGVDEDHRMVILVGSPDSVNACLVLVNKTLERARHELPPLPPPISSGWRPVPSVGGGDGWAQGDGPYHKRPRSDDFGPPPPPPPPGGSQDGWLGRL